MRTISPLRLRQGKPRAARLTTLAVVALLAGPGTAAAQTPTDYDSEDNGLIDVTTLAQLNAIRHDLNGNGDATHADYVAAFPNRDTTSGGRMGCPSGTCTGYELKAALSFDANGDGDGSDSGDHYYNGGLGWEPLGNTTTRFTATFDGNEHTISHLFINRTSGTGSNRAGLFGRTTGATLRDISLSNVQITAEGRAGALVGHADEGTISNCDSSGSVTVSGDRAGGLVGQLNAVGGTSGTISGSHSTATVTAQGGEAGGLTALLLGGNSVNASVSSSYATGDVSGTTYAGGLVGRVAPGNISESYATGAVTASGSDAKAGGLVGWFRASADGGGFPVQVTSNLTASYATGRVSVTATGATATAKAGGLVGENNAHLQNDGHRGNRATANIRASYATGAVHGAGANNDLGGLVGFNTGGHTRFEGVGVEGAPGIYGITNTNISTSYATGPVTGESGAQVGGLVGDDDPMEPPSDQVGKSYTSITDSYWDTGTTGIDDDTGTDAPEGKNTRELQRPNGYTGIYANWNLDLDGTTGNDDPWDFGMPLQYPKLKYGSQDPIVQGSQAMGETDHGNFPVVGEPIWVCLIDTNLRAAKAWAWERSDDGYSSWTSVAATRGENRAGGDPTYLYIPNNAEVGKYFRAKAPLTGDSEVYTRVFGKVRAADAATDGAALSFAGGNTMPRVGTPVRLTAGQLPAGAVNERWGWQRCDNSDDTYTDCQYIMRSLGLRGSTSATLSYTPMPADLNKYLRAYVYYETSGGVWTKSETAFTGAVSMTMVMGDGGQQMRSPPDPDTETLAIADNRDAAANGAGRAARVNEAPNVTDNRNATAATTGRIAAVNPPPTASFTYEEHESIPFGIVFDASASVGDITNYGWGFGEDSAWAGNTPGSGPTPLFVYDAVRYTRGGVYGYEGRRPAVANYPVTLTVTNRDGMTDTHTEEIRVTNTLAFAGARDLIDRITDYDGHRGKLVISELGIDEAFAGSRTQQKVYVSMKEEGVPKQNIAVTAPELTVSKALTGPYGFLTHPAFDTLRPKTLVVNRPAFSAFSGGYAQHIAAHNILWVAGTGNVNPKFENFCDPQGAPDRDIWNPNHSLYQPDCFAGRWSELHEDVMEVIATGKVLYATAATRTQDGSIEPNPAAFKCGDTMEHCFAVTHAGSTSIAAARLSSAVFHLFQLYEDANDVAHALKSCTEDVGEPGVDREFGQGLVDFRCTEAMLPVVAR